ncbi:MAG: hypothetical protein D6B28_01390 [Gammaproteobacteria bacterium]|nr:MAG: hypothetical protein D6B28_01390 [Gammaproteobacteria bacterium]
MGVIITSHRTIIFSLICATLVSILFFVAGYMLGKKNIVDPDARIAMIFPVQGVVENGNSPEEDLPSNKEQLTEEDADNEIIENVTKPQVSRANTETEKAETKENLNDGQKSDSKTKSAQQNAKKKEAAKSQSKTQQHDADKKITKQASNPVEKKANADKTVEKIKRDAGNQSQTPVSATVIQEIDLEKQTEKPAGARYSIQIEAFGVQRNADRFLKKIKQKYPSAYIFENKQKKRLPLAVRVGYFVSYRKALETAKVFQARENRAAMVVKINQ